MNPIALLSFFAGALIPTLLVSRLLFLILKKWDGGWKKPVFINIISWLIAGLLAGMGMADGGAFAAVKALAMYSVPQSVWLAYDLYRWKKSK